MADFIVLRNSVHQANWLAYLSYLASNPGATPDQWIATCDPNCQYTTAFGFSFKVASGGWKPTYTKKNSEDPTISGALDVSVGNVWFMQEYAIYIKDDYYDEECITDSDHLWVYPGTRSNLLSLYLLNNPLASPSNKIYLVDHFAAASPIAVGVAGILSGDHVPTPYTTIISGKDALYSIAITFTVLQAVA